jgi:hypothetical protein
MKALVISMKGISHIWVIRKCLQQDTIPVVDSLDNSFDKRVNLLMPRFLLSIGLTIIFN